MTRDAFVPDFIGAARTSAAAQLTQVRKLGPDRLSVILTRFQHVVGTHTVPWLMTSWTRVKTECAREACRGSLMRAVSQDDPRQLWEFVGQLPGHFQYAHEEGLRDIGGSPLIMEIGIRIHGDQVSATTGLHGLVVAAYLEAASFHLLPLLGEIGGSFSFQNMRFIEQRTASLERFTQALTAGLYAELDGGHTAAAFNQSQVAAPDQLPGFGDAQKLVQFVFST